MHEGPARNATRSRSVSQFVQKDLVSFLCHEFSLFF
jgi:hypothetical protein